MNPNWGKERKQVGTDMGKKKVAVIGAGSMGTSIALLLHKNGHQVNIWSKFEQEVKMINDLREQTQKLPGVKIPEDILCTDNLNTAVNNAKVVVLVVPSQTVRENAAQLKDIMLKDVLVACFSKGLEKDTGLRMSQVICDEISGINPVVLSGPCHAEELAAAIPTAYVAASKSEKNAKSVQDIFMSETFRVYTNPDIIGVELGGALKNVIALCAGISDGLGFGDNTKAALMTRGMLEIKRLGMKMGAQPETFAGLTGIGDLIVTCTSMHSRNRRAGILIGKGNAPQNALDEIKMVVEGVTTAAAARRLAQQNDVEMPITQEACRILFECKNPKDAVSDLMGRKKKHEIEDVVDKSNW